ncbi:MAG TPA: hypothetical protein PKA64_14565 [Myxococcota bacterium]|nr:hypothetical protein [Myxococcota bacterium]
MDNAVALVQAFLRLHGYLTVTEFPIVRRARHGGYQSITDLDVLAYRFPVGPRQREKRVWFTDPEADRLLDAPARGADMIIGEVKEGRAELNAAALDPDVLWEALYRFGCCDLDEADGMVTELLRHGTARSRHGPAVRMVAFGSAPSMQPDRRYHVVLLGTLVEQIRGFIRAHWEGVRAAASKDPAFSFLLMLEKAARNGEDSSAANAATPDDAAGRA